VRTLRTIVEVRAALVGARQADRRIALIPTMGAFHDGHLSLMRAARSEADVVVVSLFVNPEQFSATEDLGAYPMLAGWGTGSSPVIHDETVFVQSTSRR